MNNDEIKELCLNLAYCETENEVVNLLKKAKYWNDDSCWKNYGDEENNYSVIGDQQDSAEGALVEKIINSVDAVLMRECLRRQINPESKNAPQSLQKALNEYFDIYEGKLANIDIKVRGSLAKNIALISTGQKKNPCYIIIDKGEGQSPGRFTDTFLSLRKGNKQRVPFVQGKFNMGGTGALIYCSIKHNLQLIISKRDPDIAKNENNDKTIGFWGFTIVRREDPIGNMKSSIFRYLAPGNEILKFESDNLPLAPQEYPKPYGNPFKSGSYIKLYEYQLKGGLKTNIQLDLYYRLSLLLPYLGLPLIMFERRIGYVGHSFQTVLSGLNVRLDEDKRNNIEEKFPNSANIKIQGEEIKLLIYAFKKDQINNYSPKDGGLYSVNGQAQGFIPKSIYERRSVGMSYLKDSILIIADCTNLSRRTQEIFFMNSRDRNRDTPFKDDVESKIEFLLRNHEGLRQLREKRRREDIEDMLKDSKPVADIISKIIKKSPSFSKLFIQGVRIRNPFLIIPTGTKDRFKGKKYPAFFKLGKEYLEKDPKLSPINKNFRIQFETDANNDYFERAVDPGEFNININAQNVSDYSLNLWEGKGTLTVTKPTNAKVGEIIHYKTEVKDRSQLTPFINEFCIKVGEFEKVGPGGETKRKKPRDENNQGDNSNKPAGFSLPTIIECRKSDTNYKFKEDEEGVLCVKDTGENGYDFYVNMDNISLKTDMKGYSTVDPKILEIRFKIGMVLLGLSIINSFERSNKKNEEKNDNGESIYDKIYFFTKSISPIFLTMISDLGSLEQE